MIPVQERLSRFDLGRLCTHVQSDAGSKTNVLTPFTLEKLGSIPLCSTTDVQRAVARARAAQCAWACLSVRERCRVLLRFHDTLLERREEVLDLIQLESGKARRYALEEVLDTALVTRHYAVHGPQYLKPRRHRGALPFLTTVWEYRHPVGVVGVIAPWNFPLILSITDSIAALVAGNAVVLRPDMQSSFTALWAVDLLFKCGLPPDVLQVVTGQGRVLGPTLIGAVDYVMFTGSSAAGKVVARQASERLTGFSLELGGKNSMLVLEDSDLDKAVEGLVNGAFVAAGQVCVSIERCWVGAAQFEAFCDKLLARVRSMKIGPGLRYGLDMGSLTMPKQITAIQAHVDDAVAKGARVLTGGLTRPDLGPLFYEPTVLTGVTPSMDVYSEETFGPLVSLYSYDHIDEVVGRINDTPYGLNASVWSRNLSRAKEVAQRIRAGTVNINDTYAPTWTATAAPIGGMRESGVGRRHGAEGILKYTEAQTVAVQRGLPLAAPSFLSEENYDRIMTRVLRLMRHIPGLR